MDYCRLKTITSLHSDSILKGLYKYNWSRKTTKYMLPLLLFSLYRIKYDHKVVETEKKRKLVFSFLFFLKDIAYTWIKLKN